MQRALVASFRQTIAQRRLVQVSVAQQQQQQRTFTATACITSQDEPRNLFGNISQSDSSRSSQPSEGEDSLGGDKQVRAEDPTAFTSTTPFGDQKKVFRKRGDWVRGRSATDGLGEIPYNSNKTRRTRDAPRDESYKVPENGIYVGNLNRETNSQDLQNLFSKYGSVKEAFIVPDKRTGQCRG